MKHALFLLRYNTKQTFKFYVRIALLTIACEGIYLLSGRDDSLTFHNYDYLVIGAAIILAFCFEYYLYLQSTRRSVSEFPVFDLNTPVIIWRSQTISQFIQIDGLKSRLIEADRQQGQPFVISEFGLANSYKAEYAREIAPR